MVLQAPKLIHAQERPATILSDNMSALQAIQNPGNKSGQQATHAIMRAATNTRAHGVVIRLQWMSEHFEVPGNDAADRLEREAVTLAKLIHSPICCRGRKLSSGTRSAPGGKNGKSPEKAATAGLGETLIPFREWYSCLQIWRKCFYG